jgi:hypothetical protein
MNQHDIANAQDPDLRASLTAMQRAARLARQTAIQTGTSIVIVQDGQLIHVSAEELCAAQSPTHNSNQVARATPGSHLAGQKPS